MFTKDDDKRYSAHQQSKWKQRLRKDMDGNKMPIWLKVDPVPGKDPFASPREMWEAAQAYFDYAHDTDIHHTTTHLARGQPVQVTNKHPRAFTMRAFATFCNCSVRRLEKYRQLEEYQEVMEVIDQIMYSQKFEYAAVNIMNPSLIARDLDISEKIDIGGGKTPVRTLDVGKLKTETLEEILKAQEGGE